MTIRTKRDVTFEEGNRRRREFGQRPIPAIPSGTLLKASNTLFEFMTGNGGALRMYLVNWQGFHVHILAGDDAVPIGEAPGQGKETDEPRRIEVTSS
jgi:hypothetical protein